MTYNFDPELAAAAATQTTHDLADVATARAGLRARWEADPQPPLPETVTITDHLIPGPAGAPDVRVRLYTPRDTGVGPGLLCIHGGGFVLGDIDGEHAFAAQTAAEIGTVVVSVDYRLAPEHPFPAGLEDCYAALEWLAGKAGELGVDPERIGVVGESAGGGLAAALALLARDRRGPALCYQYLGVPELDDRLDTPSMRAFSDTPCWNSHNALLSWTYYLGEGVEPGSDAVSPYAAPARASDLSGLPPAHVVTCEFDPLRDEGLDYARRLILAGVPTELHHYPGTYHGCQGVETAAVVRRMHREKTDALRRGLRA